MSPGFILVKVVDEFLPCMEHVEIYKSLSRRDLPYNAKFLWHLYFVEWPLKVFGMTAYRKPHPLIFIYYSG